MSKDPEALKIYVLPVSGGWFPMQLMLLSQVYQARLLNAEGRFQTSQQYTPDICCAASGGNIAAYVAMAGDWTDLGIRKVSSYLHSEIFCRNWWPQYMTFLPTWILGIFSGALFRTGYGANILLDKIFTSRTIQRTEIWTGTYNQTTKNCELFCNKSSNQSHIQSNMYNQLLYRSMPLNYLDGDMSKIGKAIMASASIPFIFNTQSIGTHEYYDGGIMYASPLTPLQDAIYKLVSASISSPDRSSEETGVPRKMQLIYFSGVNIDTDDTKSRPVGVSNMVSAIRGLTLSIALQDRVAAISILTCIAGGRRDLLQFSSYPNLEISILAKLLKDSEPYHYVLYLYAPNNTPLDMTCFKTHEINTIIERSGQEYSAHIWVYKP